MLFRTRFGRRSQRSGLAWSMNTAMTWVRIPARRSARCFVNAADSLRLSKTATFRWIKWTLSCGLVKAVQDLWDLDARRLGDASLLEADPGMPGRIAWMGGDELPRVLHLGQRKSCDGGIGFFVNARIWPGPFQDTCKCAWRKGVSSAHDRGDGLHRRRLEVVLDGIRDPSVAFLSRYQPVWPLRPRTAQ